MNGVRLVCFDIGGVLVRICSSFMQACERAGLPLRVGIEASWGAAGDEAQRGYHLGDIDDAQYAAAMSAATNGAYSPQEVMAIHAAWVLDPHEGCAELIAAVHSAGVETAILSNTNSAHWRDVQRLHAVRLVRHHFLSHCMAKQKPDPAVYRAVERELAVGGDEVAFFDDTAENVRAAEALGWRATLIAREQATAPQMLDALRQWGVLR